MVVQLAHAPLPVAPAVGALSLAVLVLVDVLVLMQRRGCLQFFDLVDMPVNVHCQVHSLCGDVVATSVVAQRQIPMVRSCVSLIAAH